MYLFPCMICNLQQFGFRRTSLVEAMSQYGLKLPCVPFEGVIYMEMLVLPTLLQKPHFSQRTSLQGKRPKSFQNHIFSSFHEFMTKFMAQCSRLRCEDSILFIFVVVLGKFCAREVLTPISFKFGPIKSLGYGLVQIQARVGCLCE